MQSEMTTAYLDPDTGEVIMITEDDRRYAEGEDDDKLPAWQREILPKVREVLASDRFLPVPSKFDIHEWGLMERFSETCSNPQHRDELISAIHGAGAFRRFRDTIRWLGIEEQWYRFRQRLWKLLPRSGWRSMASPSNSAERLCVKLFSSSASRIPYLR